MQRTNGLTSQKVRESGTKVMFVLLLTAMGAACGGVRKIIEYDVKVRVGENVSGEWTERVESTQAIVSMPDQPEYDRFDRLISMWVPDATAASGKILVFLPVYMTGSTWQLDYETAFGSNRRKFLGRGTMDGSGLGGQWEEFSGSDSSGEVIRNRFSIVSSTPGRERIVQPHEVP
jgi:hypothetical protein